MSSAEVAAVEREDSGAEDLEETDLLEEESVQDQNIESFASRVNEEGNEYTSLCQATLLGDLEKVRQLLTNTSSSLPKRELEGCHRQTPLHIAVDSGRLDIVKELLFADAEVDETDVDGDTPLLRAVLQDKFNSNIILLLCREGADPDIANKGRTARGVLEKLKVDGDAHCPSTDKAKEAKILYKALEDFAEVRKFVKLKAACLVSEAKRPESLQLAAKLGSLQACKRLIKAGALPNARNCFRQRPVDIAEAAGHEDVAEYLKGLEMMGRHCLGEGHAFSQAMSDTRQVVQVEWYLHRIRGPVKHSFLKVTVAKPEDHTDIEIYVLEKSLQERSHTEQFKNGVTISYWPEVARNLKSSVRKPFRALSMKQFELKSDQKISVMDMRNAAVELGDYHIGTSNCHHGARAAFNICAQEKHRVSRLKMPNVLLTGLAGIAKNLFGVDFATSRSQLFKAQSVTLQSRSSALYSGSFPFVDNCDGGVHVGASEAAELSGWIYEPASSLPKGYEQLFLDRSPEDGSPVQWAVVGTSHTFYIVFQGTNNVMDALIDLGITTFDEASHGVRVHSGMWMSLRQSRHHVHNMITAKISELRGDRDLVLCGHSLGGGYAILTALELLDNGVDGVSNMRVVTFGPPQVLVPDFEKDILRQLQPRVWQYINEWDIVPRMPSCRHWVFEVLPLLRTKFSGVFVVEVDFREALSKYLGAFGEELIEQYGHIGTLLVVRSSQNWATQRCSFSCASWREDLNLAPPKEVSVLAQHLMSDGYLPAMTALDLTRRIGGPEG